jgi:hypothetical protein
MSSEFTIESPLISGGQLPPANAVADPTNDARIAATLMVARPERKYENVTVLMLLIAWRVVARARRGRNKLAAFQIR